MKVETVEVLLVCVIIAIQLWVFTRTLLQIGIFRKIIPNVAHLKISKIEVPTTDLQRLTPKEILENIQNYRSNKNNDSGSANLNFIKINENPLPAFSSEDNNEVLYFSSPNVDGSFNVKSASTIFKEGASIYKIQKLNLWRALVQIDDKNSSMALALSYPNRTIDPVCESSNLLNSTSRKIITVSPGELELVEDKWKLIRKAKIRYENDFIELSKEELKSKDEIDEVNIIECEVETNHVFEKILFATNNYLIRNRGAASDFNLMKDITERNTNVVEEDINLSIAIPLYLGLMGTMIGIVIGLFNIPSINSVLGDKVADTILNEGITLLIGGVKIAMIASFSGLLLTIINSGWAFKGSRSLVEARKNDFYTLIQIELLPIINQGLASTLDSLQRNLFKFNNEFTTNLRQLSGIFDSNITAIRAQKELLDKIDSTKVVELTKYNIKVLQEIQSSTIQFEKFNRYLSNINSLVNNSQIIVEKTNEILIRTDSFKTIADNIDSRLTQSQELLSFLHSHFNALDERKQLIQTSVIGVDNTITEALNQLKEHTQNSIKRIQEFTIEEVNALKIALAESKTNLSNLEHLATLNLDVSQFRTNSASQGEVIKAQIYDLNKNLSKSIAILEKIEHNSLRYTANRFLSFIKRMFISKKK